MSVPPLSAASNAFITHYDRSVRSDAQLSTAPSAAGRQERLATAIVYCEANFGAVDGKTANGLVRHSEKYEILSVIDSERAGLDAGMVVLIEKHIRAIGWVRGRPQKVVFP